MEGKDKDDAQELSPLAHGLEDELPRSLSPTLGEFAVSGATADSEERADQALQDVLFPGGSQARQADKYRSAAPRLRGEELKQALRRSRKQRSIYRRVTID